MSEVLFHFAFCWDKVAQDIPEPEFSCSDITEFEISLQMMEVTPCQQGLQLKEEVAGGGRD